MNKKSIRGFIIFSVCDALYILGIYLIYVNNLLQNKYALGLTFYFMFGIFLIAGNNLYYLVANPFNSWHLELSPLKTMEIEKAKVKLLAIFKDLGLAIDTINVYDETSIYTWVHPEKRAVRKFRIENHVYTLRFLISDVLRKTERVESEAFEILKKHMH